MRVTLLLFLGLFMSFVSYGQSDSLYNETKYPLLVGKIDLANFANPEDPSWLFSLEFYPFIKWVSLSQEVGFVSNIREDETASIVSSLKYRSEIRLYSPDVEVYTSDFLVFYLGGSYQRRNLTINDTYILGYECSGGDCVYYQQFTGDISTQRDAYQMHVGIQSRAKRIVFEADAGVGEYQFNIDRDMINNATMAERNRFLSEANLGRNQYITFRFKVGYRLINR